MCKKLFSKSPNVYGFGHREYYDQVIKILRKEDSDLIDGYAGIKSLELINAIYSSIETGNPVELDDRPMSLRLGKQSHGS